MNALVVAKRAIEEACGDQGTGVPFQTPKALVCTEGPGVGLPFADAC